MAASVALELTQSLLTNGAQAAAIFMPPSLYWKPFSSSPKRYHEPPSLHDGDYDVPLILYRSYESTN